MKNAKSKTFELNGETFLTTTGIAEKIGCSPKAIQILVAKKEIRHIRVLKHLLFRPSFADEFINSKIIETRR